MEGGITAHVKRNDTNNNVKTCVLQEILELKQYSPLILIIHSTMFPGNSLLKYLRTLTVNITIDMKGALKMDEASLKTDETSLKNFRFIFLSDLVIQIILCEEKEEGGLANLLQKLTIIVDSAKRMKVTMIADIQSDLCSPESVSGVAFISDTIIRVKSEMTRLPFSISLSHRFPGGKVKSEECIIIIRDGKTIIIIDNDNNNTVGGGGGKALPTTNNDSLRSTPPDLPSSTFNLGITSEQASVKANILLPHLRMQMEQLELPSTLSKPILAEDYDDEDPDADLDI